MVEILEKVLVILGLISWIMANYYSVIRNKKETKMIERKEKCYQRVLDNGNPNT